MIGQICYQFWLLMLLAICKSCRKERC